MYIYIHTYIQIAIYIYMLFYSGVNICFIPVYGVHPSLFQVLELGLPRLSFGGRVCVLLGLAMVDPTRGMGQNLVPQELDGECIHIYIYTYIHIYIYFSIFVYIYIHECMDIDIYICMCIQKYIYIYTHTYVYIYKYIHTYVYIYSFICIVWHMFSIHYLNTY